MLNKADKFSSIRVYREITTACYQSKEQRGIVMYYGTCRMMGNSKFGGQERILREARCILKNNTKERDK